MKNKELREQIEDQHDQYIEVQQKLLTYKSMAKTYWERWRFELDERKQLLSNEREKFKHQYKSGELAVIDRSLLNDPSPESTATASVYVGRGSFGIVKFQIYRGIPVAVKEFLPRTCIEDVHKEASILQKLCHPYLPLFLGICTSKMPYIVVMQYHGINGKSITVKDELIRHTLVTDDIHRTWIVLCAQLIEALAYLHGVVGIIHNDLKSNNVLFSHVFKQKVVSAHARSLGFQLIVIDFGKASLKDSGKKYTLSCSEIEQYRKRFPHMAPELVDAKKKESTASDIYAYGMLLNTIITHYSCFSNSGLQSISEKCCSRIPSNRPSAMEVSRKFELLLKKSFD